MPIFKPMLATAILLLSLLAMPSCSGDNPLDDGGQDTVVVPPAVFNIDDINDTYAEITAYAQHGKWGPHNVHDPSIIDAGEYFYCYSTDAAFGIDVPPGIQIRKSKDLVDWRFEGWVFSGLPRKGADFIKANGGTPYNSLWAPYVLKAGNEYRLYYSLSSAKLRLSVIGMATASNPVGPWTEKDLVVTSLDNNTIQTNAIDPTVLVTPAGEHWLYYGSAWDGIYILKLNAATGLPASNGDKGRRVTQRGFTGGKVNGNLEGADIIYNSTFNKYYLFVAYDWLFTKYNVRVGRADTPEGPFYDFEGADLNVEQDHGPMIIAPYQFTGHGGWQGTAHCTVFRDGDQYYIAHQGRPGVNPAYMNLHVRKLYWTAEGWPVASPERYAGTAQTAVAESELVGTWQRIMLGYRVVPGYSNEQTTPDMQVAQQLVLNSNHTLGSVAGDTWSYAAPWLTLHWHDAPEERVHVERGRDWENKKVCLIFTGLNTSGTAVWGKK
jgi:arabinan endo-1,5-alpha-L-arabinosidase